MVQILESSHRRSLLKNSGRANRLTCQPSGRSPTFESTQPACCCGTRRCLSGDGKLQYLTNLLERPATVQVQNPRHLPGAPSFVELRWLPCKETDRNTDPSTKAETSDTARETDTAAERFEHKVIESAAVLGWQLQVWCSSGQDTAPKR